ncbi:hypothetical protein [Litorimonas sp.]|uniref:hypothetical protein n=1 Tax=Litorimonas sp. TaxID=1892381 RepID=UPI003A8C7831
MNFECYGPYELNWWEDNDRWRADFWKQVEAEYDGLSEAIGCYVFCLRFGEKYLPWYVGQTLNQYGFKGEVFESHKVLHYEELMDEKQRHQPFLMLFPLMTEENWNFSKNRSKGSEQIDWLETTLISMAYSANPEIRNMSKTAFSRYIYVNGIIGAQYPGRKTDAARVASKMFNLS